MTFLSILFALLIEQFRPMRASNLLYSEIKGFAARVEAWCNAGHARHGRFGWMVVVAVLTVPVLVIHWIAASLHPLLEFAWGVLVAYLTLGFRHYSHYFTSIQIALLAGDESEARRLLAEWIRQDTAGMETADITRIAIEKALITSHRNVFGVFFWFLLPFGPVGAVLYRIAEYLARAWNEPERGQGDNFGHFAERAFYWIDWIPVRLTAIAFAVVGDFEDAIYAWRNFASRWADEAVGIILATGGGAMGVRLGNPAEKAVHVMPADVAAFDVPDIEPESMPGEEPGMRAFQSAVGLVWRALLLWMLLLLLLSIAIWIG